MYVECCVVYAVIYVCTYLHTYLPIYVVFCEQVDQKKKPIAWCIYMCIARVKLYLIYNNDFSTLHTYLHT